MSDDPLRDALALAAEYRTRLEAMTEEHEAALAHAHVLETDLQERNEQLRVAVQELSTPVIEIWDDVLAVPLVGVIDRARGQQMIERVLGGVVRTGSRWVILDLTGSLRWTQAAQTCACSWPRPCAWSVRTVWSAESARLWH